MRDCAGVPLAQILVRLGDVGGRDLADLGGAGLRGPVPIAHNLGVAPRLERGAGIGDRNGPESSRVVLRIMGRSRNS